MEEWIGERWHRFVTRRAEGATSAHEARLADARTAAALLLHAGGARQRIAVAGAVRVGGARSLWQRLAGSGRRVPLAQLDAEVLALPERVAAFDDAALNRDLYLWWAALAACTDPRLPWLQANRAATAAALQRFPGLRARWEQLRVAELALRETRDAGRDASSHDAEARVRLELARGNAATPAAPGLDIEPSQHEVAPVWSWIVPCATAAAGVGDGAEPKARRDAADRVATALPQRRRAQRSEAARSRTPLLLAAKVESLTTFADPLAVDRAQDDEDDGSASVAAEELERLTLQRSEGSVAARVRFDLDLPSASADDLPVGPGERLPEWDPRQHCLQPDRVHAQLLVARDAAPWQPAPALAATAARLRRRMDLQRAAPRWQRGLPDGEAIDLDAWVRSRGAATSSAAREALYLRRVRGQRELATLLLADLSLSTDAYANDRQRIVDVIRDALYVFGEALSGSGDAFAMLGFSSVKRRLRLHQLKGFDERWGAPPLSRLGALKPGYYTRMGAALRAGTRRLAARPERQRLLLLLTDGKPHDLDGYEGRLGVEDTRQAVLEARRAGLLPFALSIDSEAGEVMPQLFGSKGWAWVRRPDELPQRLASLYGQLTR